MRLLSAPDYKKSFKSDSPSDLKIKNGSEERAINGGYHLAIGDAVSYQRGHINYDNGKLSILADETIVFKSREYFYVPEDICGFAVNRVWDGVRQLRIDSTFIDPGYEGKLHIIVTNHGKNPVTLTTKEPLLKVVMFKMDESISKAAIAPNRNDIDNYLNRMADDIIRNDDKSAIVINNNRKRAWFFVLALLLAIAIAIEIYLYNYLERKEFLMASSPIISIVVAAIIAPISNYFFVK